MLLPLNAENVDLQMVPCQYLFLVYIFIIIYFVVFIDFRTCFPYCILLLFSVYSMWDFVFIQPFTLGIVPYSLVKPFQFERYPLIHLFIHSIECWFPFFVLPREQESLYVVGPHCTHDTWICSHKKSCQGKISRRCYAHVALVRCYWVGGIRGTHGCIGQTITPLFVVGEAVMLRWMGQTVLIVWW